MYQKIVVHNFDPIHLLYRSQLRFFLSKTSDWADFEWHCSLHGHVSSRLVVIG